VTYNVITRIKAVLINALIGLLVTVICSPNARRHNIETGVHMPHVRTVLAPDVQSDSGAMCLGIRGNVGWAVRVLHGDSMVTAEAFNSLYITKLSCSATPRRRRRLSPSDGV
jgi:hypothetical protein